MTTPEESDPMPERRNPSKPAPQMRTDADHERLLALTTSVVAAWREALASEPIASELFTTKALRDALTELTEELS